MSQRQADLEGFIQEALKVEDMTRSEGWAMIRRDIDGFLADANKAWAAMTPDSQEFKRLQLDVLACRKLIDLVEDYKANRIQAEREWLKTQFPSLYIESDVDNESPLNEAGE